MIFKTGVWAFGGCERKEISNMREKNSDSKGWKRKEIQNMSTLYIKRI